MKLGVFFSALLGGIAGFWSGLLIAFFSGLHEKIYAMTIALAGAAVLACLSILTFDKLSDKSRLSKALASLIVMAALAALVFTFLRTNR
jgi:hypothetical protein